MTKVKIIADSSCDIPDAQVKEHNIELVHIPITVDGKGLHERKDFSIDEYYGILANAKEIPKTSMVPEPVFYEAFKRALDDEYTDVIVATISSTGSGTNNSAQSAKQRLYEEHPGSEADFKIHIFDSRSYSIGFGYPVLQAAKMVGQGKPLGDVLAYLADCFDRLYVYLGVYTLEHLKRCGRVSGISAFIGEALGLRPIVSIINGENKVMGKVRGDKKIVPHLLETYRKTRTSPDDHVVVLYGQDENYAKELAELLTKETGRPTPIFRAGAAIVTNTGPRPVALACLGRSHKA